MEVIEGLAGLICLSAVILVWLWLVQYLRYERKMREYREWAIGQTVRRQLDSLDKAMPNSDVPKE